MSREKSYQQGMVDGLELWGRVCGEQSNCDNCPIGLIRGTNVTCQDFARQFPAKMLSLLSEMDAGETTYFNEFCIRFPECNMDVEAVSKLACRRAVFEGYLDCECTDDSECLNCWSKRYVGDVSGNE